VIATVTFDLALRRCMLKPIPAIAEAAGLLSDAVDAHLAGDAAGAAALFAAADMPAIAAWTQSLWGTENPAIHRYRAIPGSPPALPELERHRPVAPGAALRRSIVGRDGHHCRYCGIPVVPATMRMQLALIYPEVRWGSANGDQHAAFQAMWLCFDHVVPHSRGGRTDFENLIVACAPCNNARNERTLEEVGLQDPRDFPIDGSNWDGLQRLLTKPPRSRSLPGQR